MTINKVVDGSKLTYFLDGRLDGKTAPDFLDDITESSGKYDEFVLDFEKLNYINSAGLRTIVSAQKLMNRNRKKMTLKKVSPDKLEIFEMTGFTRILNIEK